jgi:hypothetical protein
MVRVRSLVSLALVAVAVAGAAEPTAAVDATDPAFASFAADVSDLVPDDQRPTLATATEADGEGDLFHPSGEEPGISPPDADIAVAASFEVEMSPAAASTAAGPDGILNCDTDGTICSPMRLGQLAGTSFHAYAGAMRAPPTPAAGSRLELGVVAFDESPRDGRPAAAWEAIPEFGGDYFRGSNVSWTLLSEDGAPFRLMRLEYGPGDAGFLAAETGAVAIIRGSSWIILVPRSEWAGTVTSRHYAFHAQGDSIDAATSAVDTYPEIADSAAPSAGAPTMSLESATVRVAPTVWLLPVGLALAGLALLGVGWLAGRRRRQGD